MRAGAPTGPTPAFETVNCRAAPRQSQFGACRDPPRTYEDWGHRSEFSRHPAHSGLGRSALSAAFGGTTEVVLMVIVSFVSKPTNSLLASGFRSWPFSEERLSAALEGRAVRPQVRWGSNSTRPTGAATVRSYLGCSRNLASSERVRWATSSRELRHDHLQVPRLPAWILVSLRSCNYGAHGSFSKSHADK